MGRTLKDSGRPRTGPAVYEILRRPNGSYDVFRNGKVAGGSISDRWLEGQLAEHGICGQEYQDIYQKLEEVGEARFVLQTGRIKVKLRTKNDSVVRLKGI